MGEEVVGLTALRTFVMLKLNMHLTPKQTEALMIHFDHENRGEIVLNDLLGSAQLYYDKWRRKDEGRIIMEKLHERKIERRNQRNNGTDDNRIK